VQRNYCFKKTLKQYSTYPSAKENLAFEGKTSISKKGKKK